jgi:hypothetical protein
VRELAMRAIRLAPLVGQSQDRVDLRGHQAVHRVPAAAPVGQLADRRTRPPATGAARIKPEHAARPPERPALTDGLLEQREQRRLDVDADTGRHRAYQPERCFPRSATSSIACSLTVSSKRAISARAACSSASSTP